MPPQTAPVPGRRARKKSRTREDLISAATHLFMVNGYEQTTISQIADLVDVSPRTFSRHFATKADVLVFAKEPDIEAFLAALARQPADINDFQAILGAAQSMLPGYEVLLPSWLKSMKVIRSTPALESRNVAERRLFQERLAMGVARRHGLDDPDDLAKLVGVIAESLLRMATDQWTDDEGKSDLGALQRHFFGLLDQIPALSASEPQRVVGKGPMVRRQKAG